MKKCVAIGIIGLIGIFAIPGLIVAVITFPLAFLFAWLFEWSVEHSGLWAFLKSMAP